MFDGIGILRLKISSLVKRHELNASRIDERVDYAVNCFKYRDCRAGALGSFADTIYRAAELVSLTKPIQRG